jgi:aminomuconate-semialdehyde/2-hydroxymuconate-6-semialdehyde dehydrogenase
MNSELKQIRNFIGGEFCNSINGQFLPNTNPATGQVYSEVADSDDRDVQIAIECAKKAFPQWIAIGQAARAAYLKKIADKIDERLELFAAAESIDNGKPLKLARTIDIPRSSQNFRFFAEAIGQFHTEAYPLNQEAISFTLRNPLGVVACISPWNLPLYLFSWKIAPALAAGNTVVAKPSEVTPMTAFLLAEICKEVQLPGGVLNIINGLGQNIGPGLCRHPSVKAISFTGSTQTGRIIAQESAIHFKKLSLEMGGKNANIIFADADLDLALEVALRSSFANQGQICLCGSRILVEDKIYESFKSKLVTKARALKVGDPQDPHVDQGAIVSEVHFNKILTCIERAKQEGGRILCGGHSVKLAPPFDKGFFIAPTIIEGLSSKSKTNQEEIFGPVVTIMPFSSKEEALGLANDTTYGLAGSLWSRNVEVIQYFIKNIETGLFWINTWMLRDLRTPFGGIKDSGLGREGGADALRFFTESKNICWKI